MVLDVLFGLTLLAGLAYGAQKGFVRSLLAFLGIFIGLIVAVRLSAVLANWLHENLDISNPILPMVSFFLLFIGCLLALFFLSRIIEGILKIMMLGLFNRIFGALLWAAISLMVLSVVLWVFNQAHLIMPEWKVQSFTWVYSEQIAPTTFDFISGVIPFFKELFPALESVFQKLSQPSPELSA